MRRGRVAAAVGLLLTAIGPAAAHEVPSQQTVRGTVRAEAGGAALDLMTTWSVPGASAAWIAARFDLNRDGRFEPAEGALAAAAPAPRVEAPLHLRQGGAVAAPAARELAARLAQGRVEVAVLSTWRAALPATFEVRWMGEGPRVSFALTARGVDLLGPEGDWLLPGGPGVGFSVRGPSSTPGGSAASPTPHPPIAPPSRPSAPTP